jgi:hypothetical protein
MSDFMSHFQRNFSRCFKTDRSAGGLPLAGPSFDAEEALARLLDDEYDLPVGASTSYHWPESTAAAPGAVDMIAAHPTSTKRWLIELAGPAGR